MGQRTCTYPECDQKHFGKGYCSVHYQRWLKYGDPSRGGPRPTRSNCTVEGCEQFNYARGYCSMHHARWKTHGDPCRVSQKAKPVEQRFFEKVDAEGDCWVWIGTKSQGYGQFRDGERSGGAHRWAWIHLVGPIDDLLHLDHLCRNRACVNPDHLQPVTQRENILRGAGAAARATRARARAELDTFRPARLAL